MNNRIVDLSVHNTFIVAACVAGRRSLSNVARDAIPDLSDNPVIIHSRWDRSPDSIEDLVTRPIVTAMLGSPRYRVGP
jgi:copper/silver efflux system protein